MTVLHVKAALQDVAAHESAHCACGVLLDLPITSVQISESGGLTRGSRPSDSVADLRRELQCTLAPLVEDGGSPPAWPPNVFAGGDETDTAMLCAALNLDSSGYKQVINETRRIVDQQSYKTLRQAIEDEVLQHGTLDHRAIRRIVQATMPQRKTHDRLDRLEQRIAREERLVNEDLGEAIARAQLRRIEHDQQDSRAHAILAEFGLLD